MAKLSSEEIRNALRELKDWELQSEMLVWQRVCSSFSEAFALATRAALLAEKHNHHPDITISYTRLTLNLTSHDVGGITARDVRFARAFSAL